MDRKATPKADFEVTGSDIRGICGDIVDWKVSAILALAPTRNEIELAVAWADHQDDTRQQRSLEGKCAQIFDILAADEEVEEER